MRKWLCTYHLQLMYDIVYITGDKSGKIKALCIQNYSLSVLVTIFMNHRCLQLKYPRYEAHHCSFAEANCLIHFPFYHFSFHILGKQLHSLATLINHQ